MGKKWIPNFADVEWKNWTQFRPLWVAQTFNRVPSFAAIMAALVWSEGLTFYWYEEGLKFALEKNVETDIPDYVKWP